MSAARHRNAFTLIEALVVLVIIGLLVALTVPAVQSARESARRMECSARLAQLGRALHNFEEAHRSFPATYRGFSAPQGGYEQFSGFVHLLPYVDQANIYNQLNFAMGGFFSAERYPRGIADHPVPVYVCPSDAGNLGCNFRFCTGATAYDYEPSSTFGGDGAFTAFDVRKPSDFTDGMSNTIGMSEKLKSLDLYSNWQPQRHFWYSGLATLLGYYPDTEVVISTCQSLAVQPAQSEYGWHAGNNWLIGAYDFSLYNHCLTPNSSVSDCSVNGQGIPIPVGPVGGGVFTARSQHTGGVNCLLMDGACRFVSNSIDLDVWRSLATRAGAESVGEY